MTALVSNANRFQTEERQELLLTMVRSASNDLRERALRIGAETLPESALEALLREEADDVVRNAGLEMLKLRGRRSFAAGVRLLADGDGDVALQAILLLDSIGDPRAWSHVRPLLHSADENIVQAAIIAAGRLGSRGTAADILPFLEKSLWLQMAALTSLGQLRSRSAVAPVAGLLEDDDLRDLAAEALARIGGAAAARALSEHWRAFEGELDAGQWLPLIAQALADSEATARAPQLRQRLIDYLHSDLPHVAAAAATAILALGPGEGDGAALDVLVAGADRHHLPACLTRRGDLAEWVVTAGPPSVRDWGYELFLRDAASIPIATLRLALVDSPPTDLEILTNIVTRFADGPTLVSLFVRWPAVRETVAPLLRRHRAAVLAAVTPSVSEGPGGAGGAPADPPRPLALARGDRALPLDAVGANAAILASVTPSVSEGPGGAGGAPADPPRPLALARGERVLPLDAIDVNAAILASVSEGPGGAGGAPPDPPARVNAAILASVTPSVSEGPGGAGGAPPDPPRPLALARGDRVLLLDAVGVNVAAEVELLGPEERAAVVAQLHSRRTIALLPWSQWLEEDRARFAPLLGDVVARRRVRDLLPIVRRELARDPLPELIACAGALRDRASSALVVGALSRCSPVVRATLFDSIAVIGGVANRRVLEQFASGDNRDDARLAARALARHATEHDAELLRALATSSDWAVRYSAADALGRFAAPENTAALELLSADPSPIVAQRARAALDALGGTP